MTKPNTDADVTLNTAADVTNEDRDAAVDRVGRALYGGSWIGLLEKEESELGQDRARDIPADGKKAARVLQARFRFDASRMQMRAVFQWSHDRDIDVTAKGFHKETFERKFGGLFPNSAPLQEQRRIAIKQRYEAGERPGRGGNVRWKTFHAEICEDCGATFDMRTVRQDYSDLYPAEGR